MCRQLWAVLASPLLAWSVAQYDASCAELRTQINCWGSIGSVLGPRSFSDRWKWGWRGLPAHFPLWGRSYHCLERLGPLHSAGNLSSVPPCSLLRGPCPGPPWGSWDYPIHSTYHIASKDPLLYLFSNQTSAPSTESDTPRCFLEAAGASR